MIKAKNYNRILLLSIVITVFMLVTGRIYGQTTYQDSVTVTFYTSADGWYEYISIPTLTEWGMIIFCVLLFGWMAWVIVRRRKRVSARI